MRLTRAALRAEATQQVEESETPDASNPHNDLKERVPLGEVSPNSALESAPIAETPATKMPPKKSKAKGGAKKGARGKKGKAAEGEEEEEQVEIEVAEVLEDARQAAGSPASDAAADELSSEPTDDIVQVPMADQRPASPPSRAVRMTRRQLAKHEEKISKSHRALPAPPSEVAVANQEDDAVAGAQEEKEEKILTNSNETMIAQENEPENPQSATVLEPSTEPISAIALPIQVQEPEVEEPVQVVEPEISAPEVSVQEPTSPEPKTLTSIQPCESDAATPIQSRAPSRSPSKSPARSPMRLEESIEAMDALEEALENVGKAFPILDHSGDEKSPRKARFDTVERLRKEATPRRSPLTTARVSRNPSAPKSLKPGPARSGSGLTRSASVRTAASKDSQGKRVEVSDYLAAKRRPISMTFPTPPAPLKSTKAPTKSTFTLPGEAVAAKLKSQREERLKRGAEGAPRPASATFVAPAPTKASKAPTKPSFQLPGEAVAAKLKAQREERLRREQEQGSNKKPAFVPPPPPKSTKPPTKANFQLPGEAIAAKLRAQREERQKREEEERLKREQDEAFAAAANSSKRTTFKARPAPARRPVSMIAAVRPTAASKAREALMTSETEQQKENQTDTFAPSKRSSMLLTRTPSSTTTTSASTIASASNRASMYLPSNPGPVVKSTVTPAEAAAQRVKAREIFNRDRFEKEAREQERREKEEAAKKARAEAAERGRIASREWAERQRKKMLFGGPA
ncbi:hypothetical protein B0J11DRAFT_486707 [Dendryphion nanum]|uniref:Carboxylesterase family protein n=1 Tax=Dendryphion nanum TaxID=256645 RepID=A0A9P9DU15_9PLEO|nr:hypothetical protein B0J11DRAFT_486707 [Dendryphion nanum]